MRRNSESTVGPDDADLPTVEQGEAEALAAEVMASAARALKLRSETRLGAAIPSFAPEEAVERRHGQRWGTAQDVRSGFRSVTTHTGLNDGAPLAGVERNLSGDTAVDQTVGRAVEPAVRNRLRRVAARWRVIAVTCLLLVSAGAAAGIYCGKYRTDERTEESAGSVQRRAS